MASDPDRYLPMLELVRSFPGVVRGVSLEVVAVTIFVALLCLCILIGHLLEENRWTNESTTALILVLSPPPPSSPLVPCALRLWIIWVLIRILSVLSLLW